MVNAIITGSRKYGTPTPDSDLDLVIFTDIATEVEVWRRADLAAPPDGYATKCVFDSVHIAHSNKFTCDVEFSEGGVLISCCMNFSDLVLCILSHPKQSAELHNVNLVPVSDPNIFDLWAQGTRHLKSKPNPVSRDEAIEYFTSIGMPRLQDS